MSIFKILYGTALLFGSVVYSNTGSEEAFLIGVIGVIVGLIVAVDGLIEEGNKPC